MDNKHSSKTAIYQEAFDFQPDIKLPQLTPKDSDQNGYDVFMGFVALSASLGNFYHHVPKTMKFLAENGTHQRHPCELVLLNNFRKVFDHHNNDPDEKTRIFHEARGEFFMILYHLLMVDTQLEDKQSFMPFMELCYELIGSDRQKNLKEHVNCLLVQVKNVVHSFIDKYLDSKIESVRNLHADKKSLSLQLGGLSIKKGIGVVHNRRLTTAAELRPEEINLNLISHFSDKLAITQKSYLDSEIIPKEKESSSRSSPDISRQDEATSAEDIFEDFRGSNFICDSKEPFHDFNTKNVSEDSSSNGFENDFLVSSVINICQKASRESEVLETPKPLQMVRRKYFSQVLGPFATSSEDDDPPLLDFSPKDSIESLNNIDINSKKEVFSDLESSSEKNVKINQPQLPQPLSDESSIISSSLEKELKESSNMIQEAKDNHKNESPKQSRLVKENMMSEESESQLPSFIEKPKTLGDITASIAYPNTNVKCLSDCPVSLKKSDEEIISSIKVKENVSHDSTIHGNLNKIQNLFSDFSNIIETMKDGSESTDLKRHKVTPTSSSFNGSVESPIIGRKDYLNYETPHLELYEKNSSRSSLSNEIGCEKHLCDERNDDDEPLNPFLGKISQTLSESRLNVLKEVDKSLTELQKKSLLPKSYIEEKNGSLQVAEIKNDSPIVEIYKSSKPRNSHDDLEKPTNETCNKHSSREILNNIKQTASDIKLNILKTMDKSLLALTSSSEISEKFPNFPKPPWVKTSIMKVSEEVSTKTTMDVLEDNCVTSNKDEQMEDCNQMNKLTTAPDKETGSCSEISENEIVSDSQEINSESDRKSENFLKWQHQRHVIAAPQVIVKLLKSKSTPERSRQDGNELSFFEQLDQFFEIMNMENCSLTSEINLATIQGRLGKFLSRIKRQLPNVLNHSDLVAAVAKYQLKNLLTRQERFSYEAVRLQLRDKDLDGKTKFEAALYGMLGYESPLLKATDGRLQMRLPHHQENIGESYLMVAFGHLGYLYRSLQEHVERLGRKGDIANAVRKCLQKELLSFYELYNLRKNQPCSLLQLYRETRVFQWRFQWLLHVLQKFINEKSIIVCLIEELDNRVGAQRLLIQNWLNSASKPLVAKLCRWLISDHLTPLDRHELPIERCITSNNNDFWQNRYMVTDTFSKVFDSKLLEMILSIGKTQVYSQKYLGLPVEISCDIKDLNYKMRDAFTQFYEDKDQEPLYKLLCKLHLKVSGRVLAHYYQKKIEPENLFQNLHHYLMLADHRYCRELIDILEPVLEEPANSYNAELLNQMVEQMPSKPLPDLYVAEAPGSGSKCWSRFLLQWRFPPYWIALLGKETEEYDMIFMGLWKFHYTNYVFRERISRQQYHFSKRLELKCFNGVAEVDLGFAHLIKYIAGVMKVLRSYFLEEVLEQAYVKLLNDCKGAKTLDDLLKANRVYLQDIKDGWFQTQISQMAIHQLERIFSLIIDLENQQHKFVRLSQILLDSLKEDREKNESKSVRSHRNRMQEFYWSCQNTCEALNVLEQRFHLAMIDFLISLHQANRESFRLLAKKLDSVGYYEKRNEKLWLIQRFAYKRKAKMLKSDGSTLQQTL